MSLGYEDVCVCLWDLRMCVCLWDMRMCVCVSLCQEHMCVFVCVSGRIEISLAADSLVSF